MQGTKIEKASPSEAKIKLIRMKEYADSKSAFKREKIEIKRPT